MLTCINWIQMFWLALPSSRRQRWIIPWRNMDVSCKPSAQDSTRLQDPQSKHQHTSNRGWGTMISLKAYVEEKQNKTKRNRRKKMDKKVFTSPGGRHFPREGAKLCYHHRKNPDWEAMNLLEAVLLAECLRLLKPWWINAQISTLTKGTINFRTFW